MTKKCDKRSPSQQKIRLTCVHVLARPCPTVLSPRDEPRLCPDIFGKPSVVSIGGLETALIYARQSAAEDVRNSAIAPAKSYGRDGEECEGGKSTLGISTQKLHTISV